MAVALTLVNALHSAIWQLNSAIFNLVLPTRSSPVRSRTAPYWCEISTEIGFVLSGRSIGWWLPATVELRSGNSDRLHTTILPFCENGSGPRGVTKIFFVGALRRVEALDRPRYLVPAVVDCPAKAVAQRQASAVGWSARHHPQERVSVGGPRLVSLEARIVGGDAAQNSFIFCCGRWCLGVSIMLVSICL